MTMFLHMGVNHHSKDRVWMHCVITGTTFRAINPNSFSFFTVKWSAVK